MLPLPSGWAGAVLSPSHARGRAFIQAAHRVDRVSWESQVKHDLQELVLVEHVEGAGKVDSQHVLVLFALASSSAMMMVCACCMVVDAWRKPFWLGLRIWYVSA
jgi:hypothetical protein